MVKRKKKKKRKSFNKWDVILILLTLLSVYVIYLTYGYDTPLSNTLNDVFNWIFLGFLGWVLGRRIDFIGKKAQK